MKDARIATLLTNSGLEHRAVEIDNVKEKCKIALTCDDFADAKNRLMPLREASIEYLKNSI